MTRVAPRHLEEPPAHQLLALEERQVVVVQLEGGLVRAALGVLVGEAEDAARQIQRLALSSALVGQERDPDAGRGASDERGHEDTARPARMTSVSTRTDGMKRRRPTSSSSVGSKTGSGWKSAMTHQKPHARGSGAK